MIMAPTHVDPPLVDLFAPAAGAVWLQAGQGVLSVPRPGGADRSCRPWPPAIAGLALSHTIAKAVLAGFCTRGLPFIRTPKWAAGLGLMHALGIVWQEALILIILWLCAAGVYLRQIVSNLDLHLWIFVLIVQSLPYLSTVLISIISAVPGRSGHRPGHEARRGPPLAAVPIPAANGRRGIRAFRPLSDSDRRDRPHPTCPADGGQGGGGAPGGIDPARHLWASEKRCRPGP